MCRKKELIVILGTSVLNMSAIAFAMLENTNKFILVISSSNKCELVDEVEKYRDSNLSYRVCHADKDVKNLDALIARMKENHARVSIVNVNHPIYEELIHDEEVCTWFTACRNGIFMYLQDLIQANVKGRMIISFDNDYQMVSRAQEMAKGTSVQVVKAMAHCVCQIRDVDKTKKKMLVEVGDECQLVFPPEAYYFRNEIANDKHFFERWAWIYFTRTSQEFQYWILTKMADVNAMHTLCCVLAYEKGIKKSIPIEEISQMPFRELLDYEEVEQIIKEEHKFLYEKHIREMSERYGDDYELHYERMEHFVKHLFTSEIEKVKRGLDVVKNDECIAKMNNHFSFLKSVGHELVNNKLEWFESMLTKYSSHNRE